MSFTMRSYQLEAIEGARAALRDGCKRILIVIPTGTGKGSIAAEILKSATRDRPDREPAHGMFAVHRREIVKDIAARVRSLGVPTALVLPGHGETGHERVLVGTINSFISRLIRGMPKNPSPEECAEKVASRGWEKVNVIIIDEAHRFNPGEGMYKTLTHYFPNAIIIGFTATPCRQDGRTLGEFFERLVQPLKFSEAFDDGWLVRPEYYAPSVPDLSDVKTIQGDYSLEQLDEIMGDVKLVGDVVEHYAKHAKGKQAVLFAPRRASARKFQERFLQAGFNAAYVDGETPEEERDAIFAAMRTGETEVLCGVDVAVEGWDNPRTSVMIFCRPTKSPRLWLQAAGRILRPFCDEETGELKSRALIFDHTGTLDKLGFLEDYESWELKSPDGKAANKTKRTKKVKEAATIVCEACTQVFTGSRKCPACGWVIPPSAEMTDVFEEPAELEHRTFKGFKAEKIVYSQEEKARWYAMLLFDARANLKKDGSAYHKFKEKFGVYPVSTRAVKPIPPDREVIAWIAAQKRKWLGSSDGQQWLAKKEKAEVPVLISEAAVGFDANAHLDFTQIALEAADD